MATENRIGLEKVDNDAIYVYGDDGELKKFKTYDGNYKRRQPGENHRIVLHNGSIRVITYKNDKRSYKSFGKYCDDNLDKLGRNTGDDELMDKIEDYLRSEGVL